MHMSIPGGSIAHDFNAMLIPVPTEHRNGKLANYVSSFALSP